MAEGVHVKAIAHVPSVVIGDQQLCLRCGKPLWTKDSRFNVWESGSHVLEFVERQALIRGPDVLTPAFALCERKGR